MSDKSDGNDGENPSGEECFLVFPLLDLLIVYYPSCASSAWLEKIIVDRNRFKYYPAAS